MTGDKTLLKDVQMGRGRRITYGNKTQLKVNGKGLIDIPRIGSISKSLICGRAQGKPPQHQSIMWQRPSFQFSKKEWNIFDNSGKWLLRGERTVDNCYGLPGLTSEPQIIRNKATIDDSELWHQRLRHLNFTDILKIASKEIVKDLPKMEKTEKGVCGPCQLGKQTRATHKKTSGILTSRNLELLHMDLMGPTRTASLGGRKYIFVVVDDYSRFTWALLLQEKSDAFDAAQQLFKKI